MNKLLLCLFYFLTTNWIFSQLAIVRPSYKTNVESNIYIKVGGEHTITSVYRFYEGGGVNTKLIELNDKFYYLILDDSLNVIEKTRVFPAIFCEISEFYDDFIVYLKINDKFLNRDSIMPKKAELYTIGFYRSGKHIEYYSNGKLKITGKYQENTKIGVWKYYSEDGKLIERKKFIKGKEKGVEPPLPPEE